MANKIGEKTAYNANGTWGTETNYSPTDEFAAGKNWKDAKAELRQMVADGSAILVLTEPENSFHTTVYDIVEAAA